MTSSAPWLSGCAGATLHQSATAAIVVTYPEGNYAGPVTVTTDVTGPSPNGSCPPFLAPMTMSIAGSNGLGGTFSCRATGSPAGAPAPMSGVSVSLGAVPQGTEFMITTAGTCSVNGIDASPQAGINELGVLAPTGLTTAALTGLITLWT
jgi:hypothetical protein